MAIPTTFMVKEFKPMKIKNVDVVFANKPGRNRNVYSTEVLKDAISYYKKLIELDPTYRYSFAKHPKDNDEEWIGLIAAALDDIYFDDSSEAVKADFTLLPSIWGQFIAWLLANEYHVGISLRGKAEAQQSSMDIGGTVIPIKQRFNLHLEGVDFVVYPSYIITNASKENISEQAILQNGSTTDSLLASLLKNDTDVFSNVLENFIKDTSSEYGISNDDIQKLLTTKVKENPEMGTEQEKLELELGKLTLQRDKLVAAIEGLKSELASYESTSQEKQTAIADLDGKITDRQKIVTGLNQLEDRLNEKQEELTALENKLVESSKNYEKLSSDYTELTSKAERQSVVRIAGKVFSSDTTPKIRVVEATDKVTNADWSNVDTKKISQLIGLTQDDELGSKVFAVYEKTDKGTKAKLPVYQAFKSESSDFDIDLILNETALSEASEYITSRKGIALESSSKSKAISFLLNKYQDIETSGMYEVPAELKELSRRAQVLEKITLDTPDYAIEAAIDSAIINGMVIINEDDKVFESTEDDKIVVSREIAHDNISSAIMNSLLGIHKGKKVKEAMTPEGGSSDLEAFVNVLITSPDGSPTDFSEAFGIESADDFANKYITQLRDAFANNDVENAVNMLQSAVSTYVQSMVDASDDMNVFNHVNSAFQAICSILCPKEDEIEEPEMPEGTENQEKQVTENTNNEDGGNEEMLYQDLKTVLEKRFEGIQVDSHEGLVTVVEKLITDYEQSYSELKSLELVLAKKDKVVELEKAGVSIDVIESTITDIDSIEGLDLACEKLISEIKVTEEVTESTTADADDVDVTGTQKSHTVVAPVTGQITTSSMSQFKKILGSI